MITEKTRVVVFGVIALFASFSVDAADSNTCQEQPNLNYDWNEHPRLHWGYNDLNRDGTADTLVFRWNHKTVAFVADDGRLPWKADVEEQDWNAYFNEAFNAGQEPPQTWNEIRGTWGNYTLLFDRDDSGRFDDSNDFYYKTLDMNHDGAPEAEYYHLFPGHPTPLYSNKLVVNLDGQRDMSYLNWQTFFYASNEQRYLPGGKYVANVQGSGFFLNSYSKYVQTAWENPIAWYDFDFDGRTNMVMRAADTHVIAEPGSQAYRGDLSEFEIAFELNGNTSDQRWHSLDMQLTYCQYHGTGPDCKNHIDRFPLLKGLPEAAFLSENMLSTRQDTTRLYFPYIDGYKLGTDSDLYASVWLLFDEDDDDNRWEEMFSFHEGGWAAFGDKIGDRWENDNDFSGKAKLYVAKFDNRIHLCGADDCFWEIDYLSLYRGVCDRKDTAEGPEPPKGLRYPLVRYYDTDKNGFIDKIERQTVEYGSEADTVVVEEVIHLLDFATPDNPHPDICELIDPRVDVPLTGWKVETWDGEPLQAKDFEGTPCKAGFDKFHQLYGTVGERMWSDAMKLYTAAKEHNLNKSEKLDENLKLQYTKEELAAMKTLAIPAGYSKLLAGGSRREKYNNGFWLREKVFLDIKERSGLDGKLLDRLYYTGKIDQLVKEIERIQ